MQEWNPRGRLVLQDDEAELIKHPPMGIKCRNCIMPAEDVLSAIDGRSVAIWGHTKGVCRAWDSKPDSVLWHNGPCDAYWPEDGNWIGDDPM